MKLLYGNLLFARRNVEKQMLFPFNDSRLFQDIENHYSIDEFFNWRAKAKMEQKEAKIHAAIGILKPLSRILLLSNENTQPQKIKGFGGYAKMNDGSVICEYWNDAATNYEGMLKDYSDSPRIIVCITPSNDIKAVVINQAKESSVYQLSNESSTQSKHTHSSCAIIYAEICRALLFNETTIQNSIYESILDLQYLNLESSLLDDEAERIIKLAYNIYSLMKYTNAICNLIGQADTTFFDEINSETIEFLNLEEIKEQVDRNTIVGELSFLEETNEREIEPEEIDTSLYVKDCFGVYAIDEKRVLSDVEKSFLPDIDKDWMIPEEVSNIAKIIKETSEMKSPIRNLIFSGEAGTGKTESTKMLALELGIPYVNFSCAPDTERLDLTLSVIPNAKIKDEKIQKQSLTEVEPDDWSYDPCGSYFKLTGQEKSDATAMDCLNALLASKNDSAADGFRYVYSNIIKAFKYGWLCEIQEPTVIAKAGVLPSINSMLDRCNSITLMNGETIERHKDCVICFTTNLDYEGCNPINQSVLSRCVPIELHALDEQEAINRVMHASGYEERDVVQRMVKVYFKCQEYAKNGYITDGAIDLRALIQWAQMNAVNGEYYANGLMCLIHKCTLDKELQIEFEGCLKDYFLVNEKAESNKKINQ